MRAQRAASPLTLLAEFAITAESIKSGLSAGFVASAVLGILMIIKSRLGILPDLDPIHDIVAIADQYTGLQFPPDLGWVGHFFIGTIVWGLLYAWLRKSLPGRGHRYFPRRGY